MTKLNQNVIYMAQFNVQDTHIVIPVWGCTSLNILLNFAPT